MNYKINKPIRLIELFGGIGSQAKALKNLGVEFTHYKLIEFDKYCIKSYNEIHNTNFETKDITKTTANDLEIVDTNKYDYILTYSFPCQDLSLAGNMRGMNKDKSTRSGLLWEVERILKECKELPQILLMENVTQIHNKKFINDFNLWIKTLEELGYSNYWKDLNSKNYGIPQNRNRTFMVSILGNYKYEFPKEKELKTKLYDYLEDNINKKYYLSENMIKYISNSGTKNFKVDTKINLEITRPITTCQNKRAGTTNYICEDLPINFDLKNLKIKTWNEETKAFKTKEEDMPRDRIYLTESIGFCITTSQNQQPYIISDNISIRKLTPKECWRLMGFTDNDFDKVSKLNSDTQLYKQAGNSIVVQVLEEIFKQLF